MTDIDIYKELFKNDNRGLAIIDAATGYFTDVNDAFCTISRYDSVTLLSQRDIRFITNNAMEESDFNEYQEVIRGSRNLFLKYYELKQYDNETIFLKIHVTHHVSEGYALIILEAISEIHFSRKKWMAYEKRYKDLFDFSPVGIWEEDLSEVVGYLRSLGLNELPFNEACAFFDKNLQVVERSLSLVKIVDINNAVLEQFAVTNKSHFLATMGKFVATKKNFETAKHFLAALCTNSDTVIQGSENVTFGNKPLHLQLRWHITPDMRKDNYRRVILASVDISHLKRAQKALEETSARIETIIDTIDGIVWTADPQSLKLNFISKKIKDITGYPRRVFLGKKMFDFEVDFFTDQEKMNRFRDRIAQGIPGSLEYRIKTKTGVLKWLQINISFIKSGEKVLLVLGVVIDITNLKYSKEKLYESMALLSEQNKRLLDFSYIVSHNLRSHTSNILGLCDLVTRSYTDNEQRKYIRLLKNVSNKLNHTIEGLSQVTHIQMAHTVSREQVYLKDCIDNTCRTVIDVHYGSKEFLFRNNVPGAVTVLFNRLYLENVLRILVSNAIKYRHPRRQLKIQLDFVHNDDERALIITDNGIGIDLEKDQGRLFGLFKTVSLNNASRGIGLYIARNQVEAMGGRIDVKSTPGKGASFKICFLK